MACNNKLRIYKLVYTNFVDKTRRHRRTCHWEDTTEAADSEMAKLLWYDDIRYHEGYDPKQVSDGWSLQTVSNSSMLTWRLCHGTRLVDTRDVVNQWAIAVTSISSRSSHFINELIKINIKYSQSLYQFGNAIEDLMMSLSVGDSVYMTVAITNFTSSRIWYSASREESKFFQFY